MTPAQLQVCCAVFKAFSDDSEVPLAQIATAQLLSLDNLTRPPKNQSKKQALLDGLFSKLMWSLKQLASGRASPMCFFPMLEISAHIPKLKVGACNENKFQTVSVTPRMEGKSRS